MHFHFICQVNTFELCVIVLASVFLTLTFDLPMQNVKALLADWVWWPKEQEQEEEGSKSQVEVPVTETKDSARINGDATEIKNNKKKKSSEAIFKSNGNLDSSNFDWDREEVTEQQREKVDTGNYNNHKVDREEHLDTYGDEDVDGENGLEDDIGNEEDEEELSEGEQHEGGNSARTPEEIDDIWGSDK